MTRAPGMTLRRMPVYAWAMLVVGFMIVFALAMDGTGLAPSAHGWSASIAALVGYVGFRVVVVLHAAAFLAARVWCGLATPRQRASFDNTALLWWGSCAQGAAVALLPHAVVALMP